MGGYITLDQHICMYEARSVSLHLIPASSSYVSLNLAVLQSVIGLDMLWNMIMSHICDLDGPYRLNFQLNVLVES